MKNLMIILTVVFAASIVQAQNFDWGIVSKGEQVDEGKAVCMDADGNSYVTGSFSSPTFALGEFSLKNSVPIPTNPLLNDMFVAKIDKSGKVVWAIQSNGAGDEKGVDIACDKTGHIAVVGVFKGKSATFGTTELINPASNSFSTFILRINALGKIQWAQLAGGKTTTEVFSVSTAPNGEIYVTGSFSHGVTFGGYEYKSKSGNNSSVFVAKYNSNGDLKWFEQIYGKSFGGQNSTQVGKAIFATDDSKFVYVAGWFRGRVTFGDSEIASNSASARSFNLNIFITKYDSDGRGIWTKSIGQNPINASANPEVADIVADNSGSVYLTGFFGGELLFGEETMRGFQVKNGWNYDIFLAKYDADGKHLWHTSAGGKDSDRAFSMALTPKGVMLTGSFTSLQGKFGDVAIPGMFSSAFTANYDANGKCLWAIAPKAGLPTQGNGIASDGKNTIVTGQFLGNAATFGKIALKGAGSGNFFAVNIK
jgi:hypothetical protein